MTYDGKSYPTWAIVLGWILGIVSLVPIPLMMIIQIINTDGDTIVEVSFLEHIKTFIQ